VTNFAIREATEANGEALPRLQARCPQGTDLVVSTVNTPDFFGRARVYERCRVYAAYVDGELVGSAACALRPGRVGGDIVPLAHLFQGFVDPSHRQNGIANALLRRAETSATAQGAALSYGLVMGGNRPSERLMESLGFVAHRELTMDVLTVAAPVAVERPERVRRAGVDDLPAIAALVESTWSESELSEPLSAEMLGARLKRVAGWGLKRLFVFEDGQEILGCVGWWDWRRVTRIVVETTGQDLGPGAPVQPGQALQQAMLTPVGFREAGALSPLIRHVHNEVLAEGGKQLFCLSDRGHLLERALGALGPLRSTLRLFVHSLAGAPALKAGPVFVDGIDL